MLKAENITVRYGTKIVLSALTLEMAPGRITAVVGPNGSGKSTLLRCLAGALRPVSGAVTIGGENIYRMSASRAAGLIAYVPQETAMPFAFTVEELVTLAANNRKTPGVAADAIALMDLTPLAKSALNTLSGGEQQRATIARGIAQQAPCLLLDEPIAHLDLRYQAALFRYLQTYAHESGASVVVVLHDLVLAARCAADMILMQRGAIAASGAVPDVLQESRLQDVYEVPLSIRRDDTRIVSIEPRVD